MKIKTSNGFKNLGLAFSVFILAIGFGLASWVNTAQAADVAIGDSYQGGIVAYILQPGDPGYDADVQRGLIAAPSNQSDSMQWYNGSYTTTGATSTALGTGNANTNAIVTSQGAGSYAAQLCADLELGGYSDWYLPSRDELNKLYLNRVAIGGFITTGTTFYLNSSEYDENSEWVQSFGGSGTMAYAWKNYTYHVRAVRTFSVIPSADIPIFSPYSSAISPGTTITITSTNADHIYYTTNGDTPTSTSTEYIAPVAISSFPTTLKALAVKAGYADSTIESATYTQALATAPSNIVLALGTTTPVEGVTNVAIPAAGATDTTGAVTGWVTGTANKIKFTVTDAGSASSTITINTFAYTSGTNYTIAAAATLTIVVTTTEASRANAVRTFTVTVTSLPGPRYWVGGSGGWSDTGHWSATSGGSSGASVPGSFNNVFIDANSGLSGGIISIDPHVEANTKDFTSTSGINYSIAGGCNLYVGGSVILESGITFSSVTLALSATESGKTITTNGDVIYNINIWRNGSWILQDDLTFTAFFNHGDGTFDANGHNITGNSFNFYNYNTTGNPTVIMGSGTWTVNGNWTGAGTIIPEDSTIKINNDSLKTFSGGGKTYNNLWLAGASSAAVIIQGSNTFNDLKIDAGKSVKFTDETTQTVNTFTATGSTGNLITLNGTGTAGWMISSPSGTISGDYLDIAYSTAVGGATFNIGTHSTDSGHNAGWTFTGPSIVHATGVALNETNGVITVGDTRQLTATVTPGNTTDQSVTWNSDNESIATVDDAGKVTTVAAGLAIITVTTIDGGKTATDHLTVNSIAPSSHDKYWVGGSGNWSSTSHWSATSGGSSGVDVPTYSDNVFIDSHSGFGSGGTITSDNEAYMNNFSSTVRHSYSISGNSSATMYIHGSVTLGSGLTISPGIYLDSTSVGKTIRTNGAVISELRVDGAGGGWTLQDNLTITDEFYQLNGTFDANDHNVTAGYFNFTSDAWHTPTVIMGSGTWIITGGTNSGWYINEGIGGPVTIVPETSTIKFNAASGVFSSRGKTYNNIWFGASSYIEGSNTFNNFKIDAGKTIRFSDETTQTVTTFTAVGTAVNWIILKGIDTYDDWAISSPSGTVSGDYLNIIHSTATGGATFYAGANSVNGGNNHGWIFPDANGSSNSLPPSFYTLPDPPVSVIINSGTSSTNSPQVTLSLNAGSDVERIAISNNADFTNSSQEPFATNTQWNLCATGCPDGVYTVYARFFTKSGVQLAAYDTVNYVNLTPTSARSTPAATTLTKEARAAQIVTIMQEASTVSTATSEAMASAVGVTRNALLEQTYISSIVASVVPATVSAEIRADIVNFITYGTPTTIFLGAGERAGVVNSFRAAFGKVPSSEADWADVIKIANGRFPSQTNAPREKSVESAFKKIYLRSPNRQQANDNATVTVMAYGLRTATRNLSSEKAAIKNFKAIYGKNPSTATDWDAMRAIAYSGTKR